MPLLGVRGMEAFLEEILFQLVRSPSGKSSAIAILTVQKIRFASGGQQITIGMLLPVSTAN